MGHRRFCGVSQSYSKSWLLDSKKSYFGYIYWRIDKNWGLRCADLFFGGEGSLSQKWRPFFSEDRAITGHKTLTQKPRPFFSRRRVTELWSNSGGLESNGPWKLSLSTKWASVSKRLRTTVISKLINFQDKSGRFLSVLGLLNYDHVT